MESDQTQADQDQTGSIESPPITHWYGPQQEEGALLQRWIADPTDTDCPIQPCTRTMDDLSQEGHFWLYDSSRDTTGLIPAQYESYLTRILVDYDEYLAEYFTVGAPNRVPRHAISTRPGAILSWDMVPPARVSWAEAAQMMYQEHHDMGSLRRVYIQEILCPGMLGVIVNEIYRVNGLEWPPASPAEAFQIWNYGTPEYQFLLGTRIGQQVAHLVLAAFPRGTRRISSITTWNYAGPSLHLQFDLEEVQSS